MKAVILEDIGKLKVTSMDIPTCGPGEVLVKLEACGICRTDLKCYTMGQRDLHLPRILGHEVAGTVAAMGENVTNLSLGDRVQVAPGIPCGTCSYCLAGFDNLCDEMQIVGFHIDGGFAEYILIPAADVKFGVLQPIPEHLSFAEAALTEPLACSVNIQDSMNLTPEDTLSIIGAGPLGILNAQLARSRGVNRIIIAETKENRLKLAEEFPIDYIINVKEKDLQQEVLAITKGKGVDGVIPCCPGLEPFSQGINLLAKKGKMGFFSGLIGKDNLGFDLNTIHYKELTVTGGYGCSLAHNQEALRLIAEGQVQIKKMITRNLSLEEVEDGLEMIRNSSELSIVVNF